MLIDMDLRFFRMFFHNILLSTLLQINVSYSISKYLIINLTKIVYS